MLFFVWLVFFFLMVLQPIICKVGATDPQKFISSDQCPMLQGYLYPRCPRDLPPDHNSFLGVRGPGESAALPTESLAPRATPDLKRSWGLHGPDPATQSTSIKAKGNSSRKGRKLTHALRGNLFSLESTGFQDKILRNTQKVQSRAYIKTPPQINCPQPPLQSVGPVHEEGRTILWLNEQAESQQSLIRPLLCHRLPSVTLEMFLHL